MASKYVKWAIDVQPSSNTVTTPQCSSSFCIKIKQGEDLIETSWSLQAEFKNFEDRECSYFNLEAALISPISFNFVNNIRCMIVDSDYQQEIGSFHGYIKHPHCSFDATTNKFQFRYNANIQTSSLMAIFTSQQTVWADGKLHFIVEINYQPTTIKSPYDGEHPMLHKKYETIENLFNAFVDPQLDDEVMLETSDGFKLRANIRKLVEKSSVFAEMFDKEMSETTENSVSVTSIDRETLLELLRFIYCGEFDHRKQSLHVKLFEAARMYGVDDLDEMCIEAICKSLHGGNVLELMKFADFQLIDELFDSCIEIIRVLFKFILNRNDWKTLDLELKSRIRNEIDAAGSASANEIETLNTIVQTEDKDVFDL